MNTWELVFTESVTHSPSKNQGGTEKKEMLTMIFACFLYVLGRSSLTFGHSDVVKRDTSTDI